MTRGPDPDDELLRLIAKQRKVYDRIGLVYCPIIKCKKKVRFNIKGFRHLHIDGQEKYRTKDIATERLELLQYAVGVVEHCRILNTDSYKAPDTGSGKDETYYNLYARVGPRQIRVMVTIRVIGGGDPHFYGIRRD
jgi:hypothetical protein